MPRGVSYTRVTESGIAQEDIQEAWRTLVDTFTCFVCYTVPFDPVACSADHIFCRTCANHWQSQGSTCPVCRVEMPAGMKELPLGMKRLHQSMAAQCPWKCGRSFEVPNWLKHANEDCPSQPFTCRSCNAESTRVHEDDHAHCICTVCSCATIRRCVLQEHMGSCNGTAPQEIEEESSDSEEEIPLPVVPARTVHPVAEIPIHRVRAFFAYGQLRADVATRETSILYRFKVGMVGQKGELKGAELWLKQFLFLGLVRNQPRRKVVGFVMKCAVDTDFDRRLYELEQYLGVPELYQREVVNVHLQTGAVVEAYVHHKERRAGEGRVIEGGDWVRRR